MEGTRKQVPIGGEPKYEEPKYEEPKKKEGYVTSPYTEKKTETMHQEKSEMRGHRITKIFRPIGITSILKVDVTNRQYVSPGTHMYIKNREGMYQDSDVTGFLNHADLKLTFTLPLDVNPDDLAFSHQKSAIPVSNPLLKSQCVVRVGIIEHADAPQKAYEMVHGAGKTYTLELPLIRGLYTEPFQTIHYSLRIAGLKMPEQTDLNWRVHLKVCQAEDLVEVISVSDTAFDVNMIQDNINTFSDRFSDMVVTPIKRRGWFGWLKKSKEKRQTGSSSSSSTGEQQPVMGESAKHEESSSLRA